MARPLIRVVPVVEAQASGEDERPRAHILVVDDRPEQRLALEAVLAELKVSVFQADSGREALRLLLHHDFALILLDVNMPGMDGFELAALVRRRPRSARTPIIFITAASEVEAHARRGYSLGAVDYVHVPVLPEILKAKAEVFVDLHEKSEEIRRQAERQRELEARDHQRALSDAMERLAAEAARVEELRISQRRSVQTQRLASAALAINAARSEEDMLQEIANRMREHLAARQTLVWFAGDAGPKSSRLVASPVVPGEVAEAWASAAAADGALATMAGSGEPLRLHGEGVLADSTVGPLFEMVSPADRPQSWLSMAIVGQDKRTLGLLIASDRDDGAAFDAEDETFVRELARIVSAALRDLLFREAREANRIKDEFLAVLSHELRTPLSAMVGWTHLLRSGSLDDRDRERAVEVIERNLKIQTQLIDELLDMSRIVSGKLRLEPAALDWMPMVAGAVEAQMPAAAERSIALEADLDATPACVWGDATRLHQVIANLLSNALKFTPRGGRIVVRLRREGASSLLRIEDNGEGIDPALLPYIFDRFTQADSSTSRSRSGLGLGLTIVKRLVELHGGSINADSSGKGLGSCFTVHLPVFDGSPSHAPAEGEGKSEALEGLHFFVVDDEPDARDFLATALRKAGAAVTALSSAAEALHALREDLPDVLISDISMPEEDGYSLIRRVRLRSAEDGGLVPAIALTALADHRDRLAALEAGYQIHLPKPVNLSQLVAAAAALSPRPADSSPSAEAIS